MTHSRKMTTSIRIVTTRVMRQTKEAVMRKLLPVFILALTLTAIVGAQTSVTPAGTGTASDPYQITELGNLVWLSNYTNGYSSTWSNGKYFKMLNDIDATVTVTWNGGEGFTPIGKNSTYSFNGIFDGNGKKITGLTINRESMSYIGLFGSTGSGSTIKDLGLDGGAVSGSSYTGGLVGCQYGGSIEHCYATGRVFGYQYVGGLVGSSGGVITSSYATGNVRGSTYIGGLVGSSDGVITSSYATGNVIGYNIGGLAGSSDATITNCYATGNVNGSSAVGGLVGLQNSGKISNCYVTGIHDSWTGHDGSLVGYQPGGTITNCYFDSQTTRRSGGKTTAEMHQQATFEGWDFADTWAILENVTYPYLKQVNTTGTLMVTTDPQEAIDKGAQWSLDNGKTWYDSGTSISAPMTTVTIQFSSVENYDTPSTETLLIEPDTTNTLVAYYQKHVGTLQIDITPIEAVNAGAQWSKDNGKTWYDSGTSFSVPMTTVTIQFSSVADYDTPSTEMLFIEPDSTNTLVAHYQKHVGTLQINITPTEAVNDGAQWSIDNGTHWNDSGSSISELSVGTYTVLYKDISGWETPITQTVIITKNQISTATGVYIPSPVVPLGSGTESDPYQITELGNLIWLANQTNVGDNWSTGKYFIMMNDIDASSTATWNDGAGFDSIGMWNAPFSGMFDGNDKKITGLTIKNTNSSSVGLFGYAIGSTIKDLCLDGNSVSGTSNNMFVGGLVGYMNGGTITNCYETGSVSGTGTGSNHIHVGGLVGKQEGGTVTNCYTSGSVSGTFTSTTSSSYVYVGGLVGYQYDGTITKCYAMCDVYGNGFYTGGLVGYQDSGSVITNCYATCNVIGTGYQAFTNQSTCVGGLVGYEYYSTIVNCYAVGSVKGTGDISGLQYSIGGLVGRNNNGTITNCYYDSQTAGVSDTGKGEPKTTVEMKQPATFVGWDFDTIWGINKGYSYPFLYVRVGAVSVTITPAAAVEAGAAWSLDGGMTWNASGATVSDLPIGDYVVTYKPLSGWDVPSYAIVTVTQDKTTYVAETYAKEKGSVSVTIEPAEAVSDGAVWSLDGGTTWNASGITLSNLPVGKYTVTYKKVANWATPANASVNVVKNETAFVTGTYTHDKGSIMAIIAPDAAASAGAAWSIDDGATWNASGTTVSYLLVGEYSLIYKPVANWDAPADESLSVVKDETAMTTGTYVHHKGSAKVTITPAAAVSAGAAWSIDDGATWNASGATVSGLPVGTYTVTYKSVLDWDAPSDESLSVAKDETAMTTGNYVQQKGSLMVTIEPSDAVSSGAQWRLVDGEWQDSGVTLSDLVVGDYVVFFKPIDNWDASTSMSVTVVKDVTTATVGVYTHHTGELVVTLEPDDVTSEAQWRVADGKWQDSGTTLSGLIVGDYDVSFMPINNWDTPTTLSVTITKDDMTTAVATYIQQMGSVSVTITPIGAVEAGAAWSIDGGMTWNDSETTVSGLPVGKYTVTYKDIIGWATPVDTSVDVDKDKTSAVVGNYARDKGSVSVTIAPVGAVEAGAAWSINGGTTWNDSAITVSDLPIGEYVVTYKSIVGWDNPSDESISVAKDETTFVAGNYIQHKGSLVVTIEPSDAISSGAQWHIADGEWQDSGTTVSDLIVGDYEVSFKPIDHWDIPTTMSVTIAKDETTTAVATYIYTGSVQVVIMPVEAVNAGAAWSLNEGLTWYVSGETVSDLPVGNYIVTYKNIPDWDAPANKNIDIVKNEITYASGIYVQHMGSLKVTITPPSAIDAGAQWSVDGGATWNDSGAEVLLPVGQYTVQFKELEGWLNTASQSVVVLQNQVTSVVGEYVSTQDMVLVDGDFDSGVGTSIAPGAKVDFWWDVVADRPVTEPFWCELFASKTGGFDQVRFGSTVTSSYKQNGMGTYAQIAPSTLTLNTIPDGIYTLLPSVNRGSLKLADRVSEISYSNNWMPVAGKRLSVHNPVRQQIDLVLENPQMVRDATDVRRVTVTGRMRNAGSVNLAKPGAWVEVFYGTLTAEGTLMPQGTIGAGQNINTLAAGESAEFSLSGYVPAGVPNRALAVIVDSTDIVPETNEVNNSKLFYDESILPPGKDNGIDLAIVSMTANASQLLPNAVAPNSKLRYYVTVQNKGTVMPSGPVYLELFASQDGGVSYVPGVTLTWSEQITAPELGEFQTYQFEKSLNSIGDGVYSLLAVVNRDGAGNNPGDMTPLDNRYRFAGGRIFLNTPVSSNAVNLVWSEGPYFSGLDTGQMTIEGRIRNNGDTMTRAFWTEAFVGTVQAKTGYFYKDTNTVFAGGINCPGLAPREELVISLIGRCPSGKLVGILTDSTDVVAETDETDNYDYSGLVK